MFQRKREAGLLKNFFSANKEASLTIEKAEATLDLDGKVDSLNEFFEVSAADGQEEASENLAQDKEKEKEQEINQALKDHFSKAIKGFFQLALVSKDISKDWPGLEKFYVDFETGFLDSVNLPEGKGIVRELLKEQAAEYWQGGVVLIEEKLAEANQKTLSSRITTGEGFRRDAVGFGKNLWHETMGFGKVDIVLPVVAGVAAMAAAPWVVPSLAAGSLTAVALKSIVSSATSTGVKVFGQRLRKKEAKLENTFKRYLALNEKGSATDVFDFKNLPDDDPTSYQTTTLNEKGSATDVFDFETVPLDKLASLQTTTLKNRLSTITKLKNKVKTKPLNEFLELSLHSSSYFRENKQELVNLIAAVGELDKTNQIDTIKSLFADLTLEEEVEAVVADMFVGKAASEVMDMMNDLRLEGNKDKLIANQKLLLDQGKGKTRKVLGGVGNTLTNAGLMSFRSIGVIPSLAVVAGRGLNNVRKKAEFVEASQDKQAAIKVAFELFKNIQNGEAGEVVDLYSLRDIFERNDLKEAERLDLETEYQAARDAAIGGAALNALRLNNSVKLEEEISLLDQMGSFVNAAVKKSGQFFTKNWEYVKDKKGKVLSEMLTDKSTLLSLSLLTGSGLVRQFLPEEAQISDEKSPTSETKDPPKITLESSPAEIPVKESLTGYQLKLKEVQNDLKSLLAGDHQVGKILTGVDDSGRFSTAITNDDGRITGYVVRQIDSETFKRSNVKNSASLDGILDYRSQSLIEPSTDKIYLVPHIDEHGDFDKNWLVQVDDQGMIVSIDGDEVEDDIPQSKFPVGDRVDGVSGELADGDLNIDMKGGDDKSISSEFSVGDTEDGFSKKFEGSQTYLTDNTDFLQLIDMIYERIDDPASFNTMNLVLSSSVEIRLANGGIRLATELKPGIRFRVVGDELEYLIKDSNKWQQLWVDSPIWDKNSPTFDPGDWEKVFDGGEINRFIEDGKGNFYQLLVEVSTTGSPGFDDYTKWIGSNLIEIEGDTDDKIKILRDKLTDLGISIKNDASLTKWLHQVGLLRNNGFTEMLNTSELFLNIVLPKGVDIEAIDLFDLKLAYYYLEDADQKYKLIQLDQVNYDDNVSLEYHQLKYQKLGSNLNQTFIHLPDGRKRLMTDTERNLLVKLLKEYAIFKDNNEFDSLKVTDFYRKEHLEELKLADNFVLQLEKDGGLSIYEYHREGYPARKVTGIGLNGEQFVLSAGNEVLSESWIGSDRLSEIFDVSESPKTFFNADLISFADRIKLPFTEQLTSGHEIPYDREIHDVLNFFRGLPEKQVQYKVVYKSGVVFLLDEGNKERYGLSFPDSSTLLIYEKVEDDWKFKDNIVTLTNGRITGDGQRLFNELFKDKISDPSSSSELITTLELNKVPNAELTANYLQLPPGITDDRFKITKQLMSYLRKVASRPGGVSKLKGSSPIDINLANGVSVEANCRPLAKYEKITDLDQQRFEVDLNKDGTYDLIVDGRGRVIEVDGADIKSFVNTRLASNDPESTLFDWANNSTDKTPQVNSKSLAGFAFSNNVAEPTNKDGWSSTVVSNDDGSSLKQVYFKVSGDQAVDKRYLEVYLDPNTTFKFEVVGGKGDHSGRVDFQTALFPVGGKEIKLSGDFLSGQVPFKEIKAKIEESIKSESDLKNKNFNFKKIEDGEWKIYYSDKK